MDSLAKVESIRDSQVFRSVLYGTLMPSVIGLHSDTTRFSVSRFSYSLLLRVSRQNVSLYSPETNKKAKQAN